jgi:hypothetical protein
MVVFVIQAGYVLFNLIGADISDRGGYIDA